jgi:hypothetical protein
VGWLASECIGRVVSARSAYPKEARQASWTCYNATSGLAMLFWYHREMIIHNEKTENITTTLFLVKRCPLPLGKSHSDEKETTSM